MQALPQLTLQQLMPWLTFLGLIIGLLTYVVKWGKLMARIEQLEKDRDAAKSDVKDICIRQNNMDVIVGRIDEKLASIQETLKSLAEKK